MNEKIKISVCVGSSCFARGNEKNVETIEKFLKENNLVDDVDVVLEGCLCMGRCSTGPNVSIDGVCHGNVNGGVMLDLLRKVFLDNGDKNE